MKPKNKRKMQKTSRADAETVSVLLFCRKRSETDAEKIAVVGKRNAVVYRITPVGLLLTPYREEENHEKMKSVTRRLGAVLVSALTAILCIVVDVLIQEDVSNNKGDKKRDGAED